jgi:hypothetical protein
LLKKVAFCDQKPFLGRKGLAKELNYYTYIYPSNWAKDEKYLMPLKVAT